MQFYTKTIDNKMKDWFALKMILMKKLSNYEYNKKDLKVG